MACYITGAVEMYRQWDARPGTKKLSGWSGGAVDVAYSSGVTSGIPQRGRFIAFSVSASSWPVCLRWYILWNILHVQRSRRLQLGGRTSADFPPSFLPLHVGHRNLVRPSQIYHTERPPSVHLLSVNYRKLECGPMPNLMVALPNIGGALCSTPQSSADAHY